MARRGGLMHVVGSNAAAVRLMKDARRTADLTMRELAHHMDQSPAWVAAIEAGKIRITVDLLVDWFYVCGHPVELVLVSPPPEAG